MCRALRCRSVSALVLRGMSSVARGHSHAAQLTVHNFKIHVSLSDVHLLAACLVCCQDAGKCRALCGALTPRRAVVSVRVVLLRLLRTDLRLLGTSACRAGNVGGKGFVTEMPKRGSEEVPHQRGGVAPP